MDLRGLNYFVKAVELGSITAAAEACHVAQPSITHAIAQLEQEFECTFLIRSRRGVTPTEEGSQFFNKAKSLLQHANFIKEEMLKNQKESELLFVSPSINAMALTESMKALKISNRNLQWKLTQASSKANYSLINEHELPAQDPNNDWQPLVEEDYYLLVPKGHDLETLVEHKQRLSLKSLSKFAWIERTHCPFKKTLEDLLLQLKLFDEINIQASVDNDDWAMSLVASGYGITIAPITPNNLNPDITPISLSLVEDAPQISRTIGLLKRN